MRNLPAILFFTLCTFAGVAQEPLIRKADDQYGAFSFKTAQDIYQRVLDKGFASAEVLQKLGNTYYFNADYPQAAGIYERLLADYPDQAGPEYYFRYAQALKSLGDPARSARAMEQYFEQTGRSLDSLYAGEQGAMEYLAEIKQHSGGYRLEAFRHNTRYLDFAPSFFGEELLFSSDRDTGNLARYRHTWNARDFMDVYRVPSDTAGKSEVSKLDGINSRWHESTTALSPDGQTLYFTRNNYRNGKIVTDAEGVVRLKIYQATLRDGVWADIRELPFNSDAYSVAHPALSPDGKTLYFASDMPGTLGQSDIFRVALREDGGFGKPENLGPKVNSAARETFPYVSSDGVLYFASDGVYSLGGLDVFAVKLAQLPFRGKVLNLGAPVNSPMDDFTFILDGQTRKGYFASNREGGLGGDDIYAVTELKPLPFACVQEIPGTVRDKITNEVLAGATVQVIDEENQQVSSAVTDADGNYALTLDCDRANFVRASRQGYVPAEEFLYPSDGKPRIIDFYLEPESVLAGYGDDLAKLLQLSTIYFDFDRYEIRPDAEVELQKVIAAMEKFPSLKIKANSHTDSRGPDAYNLWLSQKRAEATVDYMVSKGIARERLQWEGYGETRLINACDDGVRCSAEEHERNRRSEFIIFE
jgi:outer membrane protein OmpA-like peptidoglycan-associated protein/Tol biopolymer transport system component